MNLNHFWYGVQTDKGEYRGFGTQPEWREYFADQYSILKSLKEHQINMAQLVGSNFYEGVSALRKPAEKSIFLRKMGFESTLPLSNKEKKLILHLLEGDSARQIAQKISRSKRTAEHHFEAIKDKLNCPSKSELVRKALHFRMLGLL